MEQLLELAFSEAAPPPSAPVDAAQGEQTALIILSEVVTAHDAMKAASKARASSDAEWGRAAKLATPERLRERRWETLTPRQQAQMVERLPEVPEGPTRDAVATADAFRAAMDRARAALANTAHPPTEERSRPAPQGETASPVKNAADNFQVILSDPSDPGLMPYSYAFSIFSSDFRDSPEALASIATLKPGESVDVNLVMLYGKKELRRVTRRASVERASPSADGEGGK